MTFCILRTWDKTKTTVFW